jgi:hypothetical protein
MSFDTKQVTVKLVFSSMTTENGWNPETKKYDQLTFNLKFHAVYANSEENKQFWKYTPSGNFEFSTINPEAASMFKFGHEYYVTFRDANPEEPAIRVQETEEERKAREQREKLRETSIGPGPKTEVENPA